MRGGFSHGGHDEMKHSSSSSSSSDEAVCGARDEAGCCWYSQRGGSIAVSVSAWRACSQDGGGADTVGATGLAPST